MASDAFAARILVHDAIRNERQERQFTEARRRALFGAGTPEQLAHLAIQCFMNEFAWWAEPDELERVEALSKRDDPNSLLRVACYRRLTADHPGPLPLRAVVRVHVLDGQAEQRLAAAAPQLTTINAGTSEAVREMYEANPYPRWNAISEAGPRPGPREILIAGCGTGRHALIAARRYPEATVLAVDLSRASLGYGMRRAQELGVTNIRWGQADMFNLPQIGATFDHIESVGTLPCVDDPDEGLRVLVSMLRPGGTLTLGLYSEAARRPLAPAMARGKTVTPTDEGIRAFRREVMTAPPGSPLRDVLSFPDFYTTSNVRDLLLHVKEHRHTIPQVSAMLSGVGLRFDGFILPGLRERFLAEFSDPTDLGQWAEYEARHPQTFRQMYQIQATLPA